MSGNYGVEDIVRSVIGDIVPSNDYNKNNNEIYGNLTEQEYVVECLVKDIMKSANFYNSPTDHSKRMVGSEARKFLEFLKADIQDYLNNY